MEQNPIYQGTQYTAANTATSNANVPRKLLFADEWERNRHATTQALQGIEQALIERNDNTVLLNQQAEAKRRDLEMTMEMQSILDKRSDDPDSWYDTNGKLKKQAVRDFIKKYSTMPTQWGKAIVSPEGQQKSASMAQAYQTGVQEAVEAAILANTKKRELQAYKENRDLSRAMGDFEASKRYTAEQRAIGNISEQEAAMADMEDDRGDLEKRINQCRTQDELLDLWYDENTQAELSLYWNQDIKEKLEKRINDNNKTQATTSDAYYKLDPKTGKMKAEAGIVSPPDGAPDYIKEAIIKYNGAVPTAEAISAVTRYLRETVKNTNDTEDGAEQWGVAKTLATETLGLKETVFNQLYENRIAQISFGGFDAEPIINSIADNAWLDTTDEDEMLAEQGLTETEIAKRKKEIIQRLKNDILNDYDIWWSQNKKHKPSENDQYIKLLQITRKYKSREAIALAIEALSKDNLEQAKRIKEEITLTEDRARKTAISTIKYNKANPKTIPWEVSSDVRFNYNLAPVDLSLPDSKTKNIIYLPKGMELPIEEKTDSRYKFPFRKKQLSKTSTANVSIKQGSLGFTVEFRHADVAKPTPSLKLLRTLNRPTSSPASISWNGYDLEVSNKTVGANLR